MLSTCDSCIACDGGVGVRVTEKSLFLGKLHLLFPCRVVPSCLCLSAAVLLAVVASVAPSVSRALAGDCAGDHTLENERGAAHLIRSEVS